MLCFPHFSKHYLDLWVFSVCGIHWSIYHPYTMLRISYVSQTRFLCYSNVSLAVNLNLNTPSTLHL